MIHQVGHISPCMITKKGDIMKYQEAVEIMRDIRLARADYPNLKDILEVGKSKTITNARKALVEEVKELSTYQIDSWLQHRNVAILAFDYNDINITFADSSIFSKQYETRN